MISTSWQPIFFVLVRSFLLRTMTSGVRHMLLVNYARPIKLMEMRNITRLLRGDLVPTELVNKNAI